GRGFKSLLSKTEQDAVFLRHAIETPGIIHSGAIKIHYFLHPLPTPWSRIEKRHYAKRLLTNHLIGASQSISRQHLWLVLLIRVQKVVNFIKDLHLVTVQYPPVHKKRLFIATGNVDAIIGHPHISQFVIPHSLLDLPSGHIQIDQQIGVGTKTRPKSINHFHFRLILFYLISQFGSFLLIKEVFHRQLCHISEDPVIGYIGKDHFFDLVLLLKSSTAVEEAMVCQIGVK